MQKSQLWDDLSRGFTFQLATMGQDVNYMNMFLTDLAITNVLAFGVLAFLGHPLITF